MTTPIPSQKPKKGCLFYGCLTIAILSLAVLVGGGLGMFLLYKKAESFVDQWASLEPMELPAVHYTEADREQFEARLKTFIDGLGQEGSPATLTLQGEDLNMLLASAKNGSTLTERVRARVEGNQVRGHVSVQLGDLQAPFFRDRYVNGEVALTVSLQNGRLIVQVAELVVNGTPLPEEYLAPLREQNVAEALAQDPDLTQILEKLSQIVVTNDTVQLVPASP